MDTTHHTHSTGSSNGSADPAPPPVIDAIRFWELGRLLYNLILLIVLVAWVAATWPHFRPAFALASVLPLALLALIANACYCAAYFVDIPAQYTSRAGTWRRRRWVLWLAGTVFAVVLANYWIADEIYPFVR